MWVIDRVVGPADFESLWNKPTHINGTKTHMVYFIVSGQNTLSLHFCTFYQLISP